MEAAREAHALLAEMGRLLGELEELVAPRGKAALSPPPLSPPPVSPPPVSPPPVSPPPLSPPPVSPPPLSPPPSPAASLSAGPFSAVTAVEAFEAALRELEGVVDVVHRGFAGESALFDVHLGVPR